jgi:hypothetical protein
MLKRNVFKGYARMLSHVWWNFLYDFAHNPFLISLTFVTVHLFLLPTERLHTRPLPPPPPPPAWFFLTGWIPAWLAWENHFFAVETEPSSNHGAEIELTTGHFSAAVLCAGGEKSGNPVGSLHREPCHNVLSNPQPKRRLLSVWFPDFLHIIGECVLLMHILFPR